MAELTSASPQRSGDATALVDAVRAAAKEALGRTGTIERTYRVAGGTLRMVGTGDALVDRFHNALAHLDALSPAPYRGGEPPHSLPDLTVQLWDRASTGVGFPHEDELEDAADDRRLVQGLGSADVPVTYEWTSGLATVTDVGAGWAAAWVDDARQLSAAETLGPLRPVLHWWTRSHGFHLVHAGAVGDDRGGVLVAGSSGSGKSTSVASCVGTPLSIAGDDYVIVDPGSRPWVHGFDGSIKLRAGHLRDRLPALIAPPGERHHQYYSKELVYLSQRFRTQLVSGFPLNALVVPYVAGEGPTTLEPLARAHALRLLAPSSLMQLPGAGERSLKLHAELVRTLPTYRLRLGDDVSEIPVVLDRLLDGEVEDRDG